VPDTQGKARIVICEDEVLIAKDLESRLKTIGYTIVGKATSGEKALELVEQHQPDLVMMDIFIQGEMDGIEAAEIIHNK
jgi:YesN/AraC family two-component response regulator